MKNIFLLFLALASVSAFAGETLKCMFPEALKSKKNNALNYNARYECQSKNGDIYTLTMKEVGTNFNVSPDRQMLGESFRVRCPTVKKGQLPGVYRGANLALVVVLGGRSAITVNSKGGACMLLTPELGASVELTFAEYTIEKTAIGQEYNETILLD